LQSDGKNPRGTGQPVRRLPQLPPEDPDDPQKGGNLALAKPLVQALRAKELEVFFDEGEIADLDFLTVETVLLRRLPHPRTPNSRRRPSYGDGVGRAGLDLRSLR
jgi:hypothetical protein